MLHAAALLSDVDARSLLERAEHLRQAVTATAVSHRGTQVPPVTISIGAAMYPAHGLRPIDLLQLSDAAPYAAKHQGRNRVTIAPAPSAAVSGPAAGR